MGEKKIITYEEYSKLLGELVRQIKSSPIVNHLKFIYTFMRGGLPIAVHLSHFLDLRMETDQRFIDFTSIPMNSALIVDDIADTGKTLDGFQYLFPTATLFYKPGSKVKPTFYVEETTKWVVYPWERIDEEPNR